MFDKDKKQMTLTRGYLGINCFCFYIFYCMLSRGDDLFGQVYGYD